MACSCETHVSRTQGSVFNGLLFDRYEGEAMSLSGGKIAVHLPDGEVYMLPIRELLEPRDGTYAIAGADFEEGDWIVIQNSIARKVEIDE
jgi:hypothetical protein